METRLAKEEKKAQTGGDAKAKRLVEVLHLYKDALVQGKSARSVQLNDLQQEAAKELMLLTNKPILYVCNVDEASVVTGNKYVDAVREAVKDEGAEVGDRCCHRGGYCRTGYVRGETVVLAGSGTGGSRGE